MRSVPTGARRPAVSSAKFHEPFPTRTTRGCCAPHAAHSFVSLHTANTAAKRAPRVTGSLCARSTAARFASVTRTAAHSQHTHRRTASARLTAKCDGCITGLGSATNPKWPWHVGAFWPHVRHTALRSITPIATSIGPPARGAPLWYDVGSVTATAVRRSTSWSTRLARTATTRILFLVRA